jgi:hypothetical protein
LGAEAGAGLAPVNQPYLFEARQMQALSLSVHIPLVCFGIAFPARDFRNRALALTAIPDEGT